MIATHESYICFSVSRNLRKTVSKYENSYSFLYKFDTVSYQFLETGILDITLNIGRDQLEFSLYRLLFFLYSPFQPKVFNKECRILNKILLIYLLAYQIGHSFYDKNMNEYQSKRDEQSVYNEIQNLRSLMTTLKA